MATISIEKAIYLSLDLEPSRKYSPDETNVIFQRIKQAILDKKLIIAKYAYIQKSKPSSYLAPNNQQPNNSQTTDWTNTTVTMESFKSWLEHDLKTKPLWLFDPDEETPTNAPPMAEYLNQKHPMYSPELAAAIETWEAVLKNNPERPKRGSRKTLIEKHLNDNYPKFSGEAKKRITGILNPDKAGGVTKTE